MSNTLLEVTEQIRIDHDNVRDLFERYLAFTLVNVLSCSPPATRYKLCTDHAEKAALANTLVRELAVHGDAE